jgi:SEC-C motif-containing protein
VYLSAKDIAPTAQALMRSRYTAYTLNDEAYLQKTWHASTRPALQLDKQEPCKWLGLTIISQHQEGHYATVEFVAKYKVNGRAQQLHEVSNFVQEDGAWFYVDGIFPNK